MTERDINKLLEDYNFYKAYAAESKKLLSYYGDRINSYRKTLRRQNKGIRRLHKKLKWYRRNYNLYRNAYYQMLFENERLLKENLELETYKKALYISCIGEKHLVNDFLQRAKEDIEED